MPTTRRTVSKKPPHTPTTVIDEAKHLLRAIAERYIEHRRDLIIEGEDFGNRLFLTMKGNLGDQSKLVGGKGAHISSVQIIMRAAAAKAGRGLQLQLLQPTTGEERRGPSPFVVNPEWDHKPVTALLRRILAAVSGTATLDVRHIGDLTVYTIHPTDPDERGARWVTGEMQRALHTIFHAIGKTEGRQINVDVQLDAETTQTAVPATA
jgi:predicted RNA-binding protein YlqC (UPF0109 family)